MTELLWAIGALLLIILALILLGVLLTFVGWACASLFNISGYAFHAGYGTDPYLFLGLFTFSIVGVGLLVLGFLVMLGEVLKEIFEEVFK